MNSYFPPLLPLYRLAMLCKIGVALGLTISFAVVAVAL